MAICTVRFRLNYANLKFSCPFRCHLKKIKIKSLVGFSIASLLQWNYIMAESLPEHSIPRPKQMGAGMELTTMITCQLMHGCTTNEWQD